MDLRDSLEIIAMAWTEIARAYYVREGLRYASDLTDAEWKLIELLMPPPSPIWAPAGTTNLRVVVNAILYMASTGCQWRSSRRISRPIRPCRAISTNGRAADCS